MVTKMTSQKEEKHGGEPVQRRVPRRILDERKNCRRKMSLLLLRILELWKAVVCMKS
jgi:hypothetical protein